MRRRAALGALAALLLAATQAANAAAAHAGSLAFVAQVPRGAVRLVDVRAKAACEHASLPGARCLPAASLFRPHGRPPGFHALRWLLGTIGLAGSERVLVFGASARQAASVGALLFLAGQRDVMVLDHAPSIPPGAPPGAPRSLVSETIFTAPMRDTLLVAAPERAPRGAIVAGPPEARLVAFARGYQAGVHPRRLRLWP